MPSKYLHPFLPPELILSIIDWIPQADSRSIALRASHPVTKTLLSLARGAYVLCPELLQEKPQQVKHWPCLFLLNRSNQEVMLTPNVSVSRFIHPTASRLLYIHCLYIDDAERLKCLVRSLEYAWQPDTQLVQSFSTIQLDSIPSQPHVPVIDHITSLYLSYSEIQDKSLTQLVFDLSTAVAPHLRHLIIDMPLRDQDAEDEHERSSAILRHAFSKLTALETFCSVRDECFLPSDDLDFTSVSQRSVWPLWSRLQTLALYNQDITIDSFWQELGKLKYLETLILTRCDGLLNVNMKEKWKAYRSVQNRGLNIMLVDVESQFKDLYLGWEEGDDDNIAVVKLMVPISYYGDEDEIELCQEWVKRRVLRGVKPRNWDSVEW